MSWVYRWLLGLIAVAAPAAVSYLLGLRGWDFLIGFALAWLPVCAPLALLALRLLPPKLRVWKDSSSSSLTTLSLGGRTERRGNEGAKAEHGDTKGDGKQGK